MWPQVAEVIDGKFLQGILQCNRVVLLTRIMVCLVFILPGEDIFKQSDEQGKRRV